MTQIPYPVGTREICKLCFQPSAIGFNVPDEIWQAVPLTDRANVMCLGCFTRLADEAMIPWDDDIQFFPVSRVTFMNAD